MRTLLLVLWLALPAGALCCGIGGAAAEGPDMDAQQACTDDAMRLCSDFIPDAEKVKVCMIAKRHQVSAGCRAVMQRRHEALARRGRAHCRRHHHEACE
jgi:hypothetical protein